MTVQAFSQNESPFPFLQEKSMMCQETKIRHPILLKSEVVYTSSRASLENGSTPTEAKTLGLLMLGSIVQESSVVPPNPITGLASVPPQIPGSPGLNVSQTTGFTPGGTSIMQQRIAEGEGASTSYAFRLQSHSPETSLDNPERALLNSEDSVLNDKGTEKGVDIRLRQAV
ncbi:hypothetical protein Patl1_03038 [Pistacia atlantica]|uniref:Uncharacterized protein n=1 Tax=Pistacia atlantica TaxID=434234 RepID=A0ACC1CD80_9ROSI|nr:hypothetical protein Patl1_03038 [Pistacia atlantica]